jgi:Flp pilus assembly pilin Flp
MRDLFLKHWIRFRHCDEGVTLVEYGIALTLAIALGTGALAGLAVVIGGEMDQACTTMSGAVCP